MSQTLNVALTSEQRDVLLRGLRFVRSSIKLHLEDPTEASRNERTTNLGEVERLVEQLSSLGDGDS